MGENREPDTQRRAVFGEWRLATGEWRFAGGKEAGGRDAKKQEGKDAEENQEIEELEQETTPNRTGCAVCGSELEQCPQAYKSCRRG